MTRQNRTKIFCDAKSNAGGMMVELMMSVALAALIIPFLFRYQQASVVRAQNIAVARQMNDIQSAMERYIVANREALMQTVGKNITRVEVADLEPFGISDMVVENADKYQLRVLKSSDATGQATLQGVVVFTDSEITPLRTREIVSLGGNGMGFIEGTKAYGTFGAWRADAVDLGLNVSDGIVGTTTVSRDNAKYLWRVPSQSMSDATMLGPLNLGGHNIVGARFLNATNAMFEETLSVARGVANNVVFQNRTTIDSDYDTKNATVSGILSADSRTMEVANTLTLADVGKFSSFNAYDLWATNMTLAGISILDTDEIPMLNINQTLDMTEGRIDAIYATVGFAGSITPRLNVSTRIEDSRNPSFFWDASSSAAVAHLSDATFAELSQMAADVYAREKSAGTEATRIFGTVSANKNATVVDFINAINQIQSAVRTKYRRLNLE